MDTYYQNVRNSGYKHRTAHLLDMLPAKGHVNILDYGCGWGVFTRLIGQHNHEANVVGIDVDQDSLQIADAWLSDQPNVAISHQTITEIEPSTFDYVISMQVIEHVHNVGNYLQSINRILKPDARLLITLPNLMNPLHILRLFFSLHRLRQKVRKHSEFILDNYQKELHHINGWDPYHFTTLVSSMGFRVEDVRMVDGVPLPYLGKLLRRKSLVYWRTKIPGLRNLSTRMLFKLQKVGLVEISNTD
ncbi:class I SAM-dependent methyltransferase [Chloroflexi bacterium TSY]|nr:class I SAM-dependent methyltransferase [Chloroflexi bacterium TSY]